MINIHENRGIYMHSYREKTIDSIDYYSICGVTEDTYGAREHVTRKSLCLSY